MAYTATIHYADVESGTAAYDEINVTTVAALSGYGSMDIDILGVSETPDIDGSIMYASGRLSPSRNVRYSYTLKTYPQTFASERDNVTNDVVTLAKKKFLWLELNTAAQDAVKNVGTTTNYHATDKCIPVALDSYDIEHNYDFGTKTGTYNFKRRFRA